MEYSHFLSICQQRRSVREYEKKKIDQEDILKIVRAGIQAPSSTNQQPWKIRIIHQNEKINFLADLIDQKLKEILAPENEGFIKNELLRYGKNFSFFRNAPCMIIGYIEKPHKIANYYFPDQNQFIKGSGILISLGMVLQNMMLAANLLGIKTCPLTGPLLAENEINLHFKKPAGYELGALLSLGYNDKTIAGPGRKDLQKFIIQD